MRDKHFIFEQARQARRTLGLRARGPWTEVAVGIALLVLALASALLR